MGLLDQFLSGYFHQDWPDDDSTWRAVVARYRAEAAESETGRVAEEIIQMIHQYPDDAMLEAKISEIGCYYWPGSPGLYRSWLTEVAQALR
ncbi:contact-dependent growth inhibition system immunity protein [Dyella mobilis]|uniref:CdiI immunity protein domain-containing protein n=1 Tax=Dyella mobilis TaxID=1849582 RepID=A0ABS2KAT2_9GAMM|nr:contact-dependent growth inhibition system immunity protein [Dyella mobilis]MBM7127978.1 hypothetical protein [Dyella mobilis]